MTDARIEPAQPPYPTDIAEALLRAMPDGLPPLQLFLILIRNPVVFRRVFAGSFLTQGEISLADREMVIDRTCARLNCEYEWGVHVALLADVPGFGHDKASATVNHDREAAAWTTRERLLLTLVDTLVDTASIPDDLWGDLRMHWTDEQLIELIALSGFYHQICFLANGLRIPPEEFAERFPSDHH